MNKTKISYADYTWNPITGCLRGCDFCYAKKIAVRFGSSDGFGESHEIAGKPSVPFPYGFAPTFHRYRLDEPAKVKKPSIIFVGSMTDIFGDWVPDTWIEEVFKACLKAAGWAKECDTRGHSWNHPSRHRVDKGPICDKQRWARNLKGVFP